MSMLSQQAKALRSWADQLAEREDEFGVVVRALVADLREAADTIESLRNTLQELQGVGGESRYSELFGTPERAARTIAKYGKTINACAKCLLCHDPIGVTCEINDECPWVDEESGYDALLEWLRRDSDGE